MKIGIIIQARMGSTRFPGKILRNFYQEDTLIETILHNLHKTDVKIVVATSTNTNNNQLENFLKSKGEVVYRGSEEDVLDRFISAAEINNLDGIIRICSDNPFLDYHGICRLIDEANNSDADYIGYRVNDKPSILTHFGFWGEFVTLSALKKVRDTTPTDSSAHEHVTYHIYNNPNEYKCSWIQCPNFLQGRNDIRLTIDTPEDMTNAKIVYRALKENNPDFTLEDVVKYLDTHEDIKNSMIQNIIVNKK